MLRMVKLKGNSSLMQDVAELYSEIFKEKPWNEDFKPAEVMILMNEQFNRPRSVITLSAVEYHRLKLKLKREAVGFIWMYEIFKSDLKEGTRYSPELSFLFKQGKKVFYLQEVGIKKEYRREGIGKKLTKKLFKKGKKIGANFIVLSTNSNAGAAKALFSKVGFKNSGIARSPKELSRTYWILEL